MRPDHQPLIADGFFVHVTHDDDAFCVFVSGELDLTTCDLLQRHVTAFVDWAKLVVMDLRDVVFMDSTGLRALWTIHQGMRANGGRLLLRAPSESVRRILDLTQLDGVFDIEANRVRRSPQPRAADARPA
jgi:anti-anti-sigma factor